MEIKMDILMFQQGLTLKLNKFFSSSFLKTPPLHLCFCGILCSKNLVSKLIPGNQTQMAQHKH